MLISKLYDLCTHGLTESILLLKLLWDHYFNVRLLSVQVVKEKISVKHYCSQLKCRKLECVPLCVGEELHLLSRVFSMYDNDKKNRLSLCEVSLINTAAAVYKNTYHTCRQN